MIFYHSVLGFHSSAEQFPRHLRSKKEDSKRSLFSVYLPYCSSDLYSGTASASTETENRIFHGKHIVKAVLEDLIANTWIAQAEQVGHNL